MLADELADIHSRLKPELFRIFELFLEGRSYAEIAKQLNSSRQGVRIKANRIEDLIRPRAEEDRAE